MIIVTSTGHLEINRRGAKRGVDSAALLVAMTIRTCGSIPTTLRSSYCQRSGRNCNGERRRQRGVPGTNQPTAQMYHVNADNAFPYRLCSGQQESGSACISSRGNDGEITIREWHPVAAEEYGYVVPDPLDPDVFMAAS